MLRNSSAKGFDTDEREFSEGGSRSAGETPIVPGLRGIVTKEGWQKSWSDDNFNLMKAVRVLVVLLAAGSLGARRQP